MAARLGRHLAADHLQLRRQELRGLALIEVPQDAEREAGGWKSGWPSGWQSGWWHNSAAC